MNKKILKIIRKSWLPFFIFFILVGFIHWNIQVHPGDDIDGLNRFEDIGNLFSVIQHQYLHWSGRISTMMISALAYREGLLFWKIANSLLLVLMGISISNISNNAQIEMEEWKKYRLNVFICSVIILIPLAIFSSGALWVSGALSYLWPAAFGLVPIVYFKRELTGEANSRGYFIFAIFAGIYAGCVEQMAAVIVAFSLAVFIYMKCSKIRIKKQSFVLVGVILINFFISLLAPGNQVRYNAELLTWYPDFEMLSIIDKVYYGFNHTYDHFFNGATVMMLLISLLLTIVLVVRKKEKALIFLSLLPLGYCLVRALTLNNFISRLLLGSENLFLLGSNFIQRLYNFKIQADVFDVSQYIPFFIATCICTVIIFLIFEVFNSFKTKLVTFLLYCASICSSLVLSISPTLYASGDRIFFFSDMLLVVVVSILFNEYLLNVDKKDKGNLIIVGIVLLLGLGMILNYIVKFAEMQILIH